MKKNYLFFLIAGIALLAALLIFILMPKDRNTEILKELERLGDVPYQSEIYDSLTEKDFAKLLKLAEGDHDAEDYAEEAAWFAGKRETEHLGHSLSFLRLYMESGINNVCVPHELSHIIPYIEYNATKRIEHPFEAAETHREEWEVRARAQAVRFPQYYKNFDELLATIDAVIPLIKAGNFGNETQTLLAYIDKNQVC